MPVNFPMRCTPEAALEKYSVTSAEFVRLTRGIRMQMLYPAMICREKCITHSGQT